MGFHFLLQGIFLTQELNLCFPQCRQIPSHLSHQRSPKQLYLNVLCLNNVGKIQLWLMVTILCEQANVKPLWLSVFKLLLSGLWSPIMFHSTATNFSHTDSTGPTWCPCFLLKDSLALLENLHLLLMQSSDRWFLNARQSEKIDHHYPHSYHHL